MHIRDFIDENGLDFEKGRGFYEFDKKEKIQDERVRTAMRNIHFKKNYSNLRFE
jgi:hypothetical protein